MKAKTNAAKISLLVFFMYALSCAAYVLCKSVTHKICFLVTIYILLVDGVGYVFGSCVKYNKLNWLHPKLVNLLKTHPFPAISPNKTLGGYVMPIFLVLTIHIINFIYSNFQSLGDFYSPQIDLDYLKSFDITSINLSKIFYFENIRINVIESVFIVLIGQFFDLFQSFVKRQVNVKDSSNIFGSRGGFLDFFDNVFIISALLSYLYLR